MRTIPTLLTVLCTLALQLSPLSWAAPPKNGGKEKQMQGMMQAIKECLKDCPEGEKIMKEQMAKMKEEGADKKTCMKEMKEEIKAKCPNAESCMKEKMSAKGKKDSDAPSE